MYTSEIKFNFNITDLSIKCRLYRYDSNIIINKDVDEF